MAVRAIAWCSCQPPVIMHREAASLPGAFILNVVVGKWSVDEETADHRFLADLVERTAHPCVARRFPVGLAGC
jgi:hypothetical protein